MEGEMIFIENDEAEVTFADDESDIPKEIELQYDENFWRKEDDEPTGYTYKGKKKVFVKAVENIKITLKKGVSKQIGKLDFKVLDCRKSKNGLEIDIELSKDIETCIAILKVFGPNTRKETTLMINKSRKHEAKFVKMLALEVIKPLLDAFISGEGWSCLLKTSIGKSSKPFSCKMCCKGFVNQANLNTHMEKYHKSFQFTSVVDNLKTNDNSSRTHEEESTKMEIDEEVVEKCHGKGKKNNAEMEEEEIVAQSKLRDRQILEKREKMKRKRKC